MESFIIFLPLESKKNSSASTTSGAGGRGQCDRLSYQVFDIMMILPPILARRFDKRD